MNEAPIDMCEGRIKEAFLKILMTALKNIDIDSVMHKDDKPTISKLNNLSFASLTGET